MGFARLIPFPGFSFFFGFSVTEMEIEVGELFVVNCCGMNFDGFLHTTSKR